MGDGKSYMETVYLLLNFSLNLKLQKKNWLKAKQTKKGQQGKKQWLSAHALVSVYFVIEFLSSNETFSRILNSPNPISSRVYRQS